MEITKEGALNLLEGMCAGCAEDFEGGVLEYLDALRAERKALASFKRVITNLATARARKYEALNVIMPEYSFLSGKEIVDPGLEGKEIAVELIRNVVERLDDDVYMEVADLFIDK